MPLSIARDLDLVGPCSPARHGGSSYWATAPLLVGGDQRLFAPCRLYCMTPLAELRAFSICLSESWDPLYRREEEERKRWKGKEKAGPWIRTAGHDGTRSERPAMWISSAGDRVDRVPFEIARSKSEWNSWFYWLIVYTASFIYIRGKGCLFLKGHVPS